MRQKFIVQWHITHTCNLRCKHCYQDTFKEDLDLTTLLSIIKKIDNFFKQNNYQGHINFTGGEPFIDNKIWYLMDYCEAQGITYGILTNGTLIDNITAKRLSMYKYLRFIQISLDGLPDTHDNIRGVGNFKKSANAIRLLNKYKIQTMVAFTCHSDNYYELRPLINLCRKLKVDRFWTDRLVPIGDYNEVKGKLLTTEQFKDVLHVLKDEKDKSDMLYNIFNKLRIGKHIMVVHTNRAMQFVCNNCDHGYKCSAGTSLIAILENGDILPCRRLPVKMGNVITDTMEQCMSHEIIKELRLSDTYIHNEKCSSCSFKNKCNGGAKCLTYAVKGTLKERDINCLINK